MNTIHLTPLLTVLTFALAATLNAAEKPLFSTEEILDESTLEIKILEDWHPVTGGGFPYRFLQQSRERCQRVPTVSIKPLHPGGT